MEHVGKRSRQPVQRKFTNGINNVCTRGRKDWFMISWREKSKAKKKNGARDKVLGALKETQIAMNWTRGSTPGPDGFGNIVPLPPSRRQLNVTRTRRSVRNTTSHPTAPETSSTRSRRTARKAAKLLQRSEDDKEDEAEAAAGVDHDGTSDWEMSHTNHPVLRQKRMSRKAINYSVEDDRENSGISKIERYAHIASTRRANDMCFMLSHSGQP